MEKNYPVVDSVEALEKTIEKVKAAQRKFAGYTQEQVDEFSRLRRQPPTRRAYRSRSSRLRKPEWAS